MTASTGISVACSVSVLTNGGNNTYICHAASGSAGVAAGGTASGNIDPLYQQFFTGSISTVNGGYTTPTTLISVNGSSVLVQLSLNGTTAVPQSGWGGGPNVSLGPQMGTVWGVHSTPDTGAPGVYATQISWYMGDNTLNASAANGLPVATPSPAAFLPANTSFVATIGYGAGASTTAPFANSSTFVSGVNMTCIQYFRNYTGLGSFFSYTSPYICHATLANLLPSTVYNFAVSATVTVNATATVYPMPSATTAVGATVFSFNTMIPPSAGPGAPSSGYPFNWALMVSPDLL